MERIRFFFLFPIWESLRMFFGEGNDTLLQYSCLKNPMDGGAWWAAVHGVTKSWTWLSDFTFTFHFHALEKDKATHSSVLAWRIPGTGEPGGRPSVGSYRVGHDWSDLAAAAAGKVYVTEWHDSFFGSKMGFSPLDRIYHLKKKKKWSIYFLRKMTKTRVIF